MEAFGTGAVLYTGQLWNQSRIDSNDSKTGPAERQAQFRIPVDQFHPPARTVMCFCCEPCGLVDPGTVNSHMQAFRSSGCTVDVQRKMHLSFLFGVVAFRWSCADFITSA